MPNLPQSTPMQHTQKIIGYSLTLKDPEEDCASVTLTCSIGTAAPMIIWWSEKLLYVAVFSLDAAAELQAAD
jgi:hypothetical protein